MAYAEVADVQARMTRSMSTDEQTICTNLLEDAALIIDSFAPDADGSAKQVVSIRMVMRSLGDGDTVSFPMGTTQGSMAGLGYSQSFTVGSGGGFGELYLNKLEKRLLGITGNRIGSHSPVEDVAVHGCHHWWWFHD